MEQMARENELQECCEFMSKLLLAYVFETTKTEFAYASEGRGGVCVLVDKRWRWREVDGGVKMCHWEEHCFGESKGSNDTWLL